MLPGAGMLALGGAFVAGWGWMPKDMPEDAEAAAAYRRQIIRRQRVGGAIIIMLGLLTLGFNAHRVGTTVVTKTVYQERGR